MTDIKKKQTGKTAAKAQKLRLNKETLKDLTGFEAGQVRGGAPGPTGGANCSWGVGQDEASCAF